jgi:signal transduction histidine kinase
MSEDLLLITRAESRLVVPDRRPTDLDRLIGDAVDRLHRCCEEKDLTVDAAFGIGRAGVPLDAKLAGRLVGHVLENAIRCGPRGGRVR